MGTRVICVGNSGGMFASLSKDRMSNAIMLEASKLETKKRKKFGGISCIVNFQR